jgi:hypothetical protein
MKHLMRYENYTASERVDDILDKISKYGIKSLNKLEKDFLDSHSTGGQEEIHKIIIKEESERVFEDDNGFFRFELEDIEEHEDSIHYIGIFFVPDLELLNGKRIEGRLEGRIVYYNNGNISPDFYHVVDERTYYDIFEFCNGIDHELDVFIDYIVEELKNYDI